MEKMTESWSSFSRFPQHVCRHVFGGKQLSGDTKANKRRRVMKDTPPEALVISQNYLPRSKSTARFTCTSSSFKTCSGVGITSTSGFSVWFSR